MVAAAAAWWWLPLAAAWQQQLGSSRSATVVAVTAARQRAISCHHGECNNQQGREAATEGSGVGTDGRTIARVRSIKGVCGLGRMRDDAGFCT
jgi:hypothetical protein